MSPFLAGLAAVVVWLFVGIVSKEILLIAIFAIFVAALWEKFPKDRFPAFASAGPPIPLPPDPQREGLFFMKWIRKITETKTTTKSGEPITKKSTETKLELNWKDYGGFIMILLSGYGVFQGVRAVELINLIGKFFHG